MDIGDVDSKLGTLQDEILQLASSDNGYDSLVAEIYRLRSLKQETQERNAQCQTKRQRVVEMSEFLEIQSGLLTEYDDKLTRQLVDRITVFEYRLSATFKSGFEIVIAM